MTEIRLGSRSFEPGRQLLVRGERVALGKRALDILSVLAEARGGIVTKDELMDAVWPGVTVEENALQVHVATLRKALGPEADRLRTIRGVGYQLAIHAEPAPLSAIDPRSEGRISLVVRPLVAGDAADPTQVALASGITDELVIRLRRIAKLRVGTAMADGDAPADIFRNAHVLSGSLRGSGDRLRISARLLDPDGEVLWSDAFDRRLADLLDMQEEIAAAIATALSIPLDVGIYSLELGGTDNPEAYAAFIQSAIHLLDFDQSVSLRYLERTVALDPHFIKALGNLTIHYGLRIALFASPAEADELLARMDACSAQALAANRAPAIGHAARGYYHIARKDLRAAQREAKLALELDRGTDPVLRIYLASFALWFGRIREAAALRRSNEEIDPIYRLEPWYVFDLMFLGRYEEAIDHFLRVERDTPYHLQPFVHAAFFAYLLTGREAEALQFCDQRYPMFSHDLRELRADAALPSKSYDELRPWVAQRYGHNQFGITGAALVAGLDGHHALAVDLMRLGLESPGGNALFYLWHPAMEEARKTGAFAQLVTDLGFIELWREGEDWGDFCRPVSATEVSCC